jgi:UPF0716 family protein affecting phage T7 exclusion
MPLLLLIIFLLLPALEIAVFIEVGGAIGTWPTVGAIILTAGFGVSLVRAQGLAILTRARLSLQRNEFPLEEAFDGLCLAVAGVLLLTPGFVTDGIGGLLLVPPLRLVLRRAVMARNAFQKPASHDKHRDSGRPVIDGEYQVVNDDADKNKAEGGDARRIDGHTPRGSR